MMKFHPDMEDELLDPIDLDRLAVDNHYRRAVLRRLKAEAAGAAAKSGLAALAPAAPSRKD